MTKEMQFLVNDIAILRAAIATLAFRFANDRELGDVVLTLRKRELQYQKKLAELDEKD